MPLLGYRHLGTGGKPVPNSVFFDLSTWHLIHQTTTRKAMHFAKELWTDFSDQTLHARLMDALELLTAPSRGLRPRTPSSSGSLALARPTGQDTAEA